MGLFDGLSTPRWESTPWLEQNSPLLPYVAAAAGNERRAKQAQVELQGSLLQLQRDKDLMDTQVQIKQGQADFAGAMADIAKSGSWNDPAARARVWETGARNPAIINTPAWKDAMDNFQKSDAAQKRADALQSQIDLKSQSLDLSAQRLDLEKARTDILQQKADAGSKESRLVDEIQAAEQARDALEGGANNPAYAKANDRVEMLKQQLPVHSGETFTGYGPNGEKLFETTRGGSGAKAGEPGTQVATAALAQKNTLEYENATKLISGLQKSLRAMDIGVAGVAGDVADKGISQIPGMSQSVFSAQRVKNRANLSAVRTSLMRKMADDTMRFTQRDIEDVGKILPSSGVFESLPDAQQKLATVRQIISDRVRTYSERTGSPNPLWNREVPEITDWYKKTTGAIQRAVQANTITAEQGKKEQDDAYQQAFEALKTKELPQ